MVCCFLRIFLTILELPRNNSRISRDEFESIIRACAGQSGIGLPDDFGVDLKGVLPQFIDSFNKLRRLVCDRIRSQLESDDAFREKYFHLYKAIVEDVRLEALRRLDIEGYANRPLRTVGLSPREILHDFLASLPDEEKWNMATLGRWKDVQGRSFGLILRNNIFNHFGMVSEAILAALIGVGSDELLFRNPVGISSRNIKTEHDVAYYLNQFLRGRSDGPWHCADLLGWKASDGLLGHCLKQWVIENRGAWSTPVIEAILGPGSSALLLDRPFVTKGID